MQNCQHNKVLQGKTSTLVYVSPGKIRRGKITQITKYRCTELQHVFCATFKTKAAGMPKHALCFVKDFRHYPVAGRSRTLHWSFAQLNGTVERSDWIEYANML
jgi:aromatic ring hydroxylase